MPQSTKIDVCFVVPSSAKKAYQDLANTYSAIEPPTWALLLAQSLRVEKYDSVILDFDADRKTLTDSAKLIAETKARLIVFVLYGQNPNSGTTMMIGASELASELKKSYPDFKIAFIGSHVSSLPLEVIKLNYVDFAFINEGVFSLLALLKTNLRDHLNKIPGIWFKDNDGVPQKGSIGKIILTDNMDKVMPGYAWDLLPKKKSTLDNYRAHFWHTNFLHEERTPFAAIYTSLGCQFGCNFCMINIVNRTSFEEKISAADSKGMRFWSPTLILKEFEKLWDYGVRTLRLSDEMFFLNKKYYIPILEGLIQRGLKFNLWAYARVDSVRKDQLELFKKAGVNWLALGIESGNQNVRIEIDKGKFKQVNIREVVKNIKEAGIHVLGNYIFGFPEDSIETMTETLDLAIDLQCEHSNFYSAQALPGSPLYLYAKDQNWDIPKSYEEFAFLSYACKPLRTKHLSAKEVLEFRDTAWHKYFSNESYLNLVEKKFGNKAKANIVELSKIKLKRKILEA
jgi:anaerobic magnesium-protoporphyrin IX monomethyl ester cyclase